MTNTKQSENKKNHETAKSGDRCICGHYELDHSPMLKHPPKVNFGLFKIPATWGGIPTWHRMSCRKCDCKEYNGSQGP